MLLIVIDLIDSINQNAQNNRKSIETSPYSNHTNLTRHRSNLLLFTDPEWVSELPHQALHMAMNSLRRCTKRESLAGAERD